MTYPCLVLTLFLLATDARQVNHNEVLIGYTERSEEPCDDQEAGCGSWSAQKPSECIRNPSWMRRFCAASCHAASCYTTRAMDRWVGHATAAGTARFALGGLGFKVAEGHFRRHAIKYTGVDSPSASLTLSSLGVGTYLGQADKATDEAVTNAVIQSVANGWNVVDTAANYRWGRAEQSVGQALLTLRMTGAAERDMLFISTKAGYAAEEMLASLRSAGKISSSDIVGGHCMHPECLSASLEGSLQSLGLGSVDLFYLHNPAESQLRQLGKEVFMQRLMAAFEFCESARRQGRIKAYGLASWSCFRVAPEQREEYLNLREVVGLAEEVGGQDHGFRYVQLPINIRMREAWTEAWQEGASKGKPVTLLQAATELGIGVFSSGPLQEAQLLGRPELPVALERASQLSGISGTAPRLLQLARSCPGVLGTLVGHKTPAHVDSNLALSRQRTLTPQEFQGAVDAVLAVQG